MNIKMMNKFKIYMRNLKIQGKKIKLFKEISIQKCHKYGFELPIEFKEVHKVLKVKYKAEIGAIPPNLNPKTFDYLFSKRFSLLENILLKLRIKGLFCLKIK